MTSRIILGYNLKCQESRLRKRLKSKDLVHWSKVVKRNAKYPPFPACRHSHSDHPPWISRNSLILSSCLYRVPSWCPDSYITVSLSHLISLRLSLSSIPVLTYPILLNPLHCALPGVHNQNNTLIFNLFTEGFFYFLVLTDNQLSPKILAFPADLLNDGHFFSSFSP